MTSIRDPGEGRGALVEHRSGKGLDVSHQGNAAQSLPHVIAKIWKSRQRDEHIRVEISEFRERHIFNVRIWRTGSDGCDRPTEKGVAASVEKLPELIAALLKAELKAKQLGWLTEGSS